MEALVAYLEAGLVSGSIYSLIGIGMNLLLVVSNVVQFAYGEIVVFSMYMGWVALMHTGSHLAFVLAATASAGLLTVLVEPLLRGLRERHMLTETMILTIAVGLILSDLMGGFLNSGLPIAFPPSLVGGGWDLTFGLIRVTGADVYVLSAALLLMGGLAWFLFRTRWGKGLRAIAHNIQAARMLGIPLKKSTVLSFLIAGLMSGATAILFVLTVGVATPSLGEHVTFKGMAVMMLGGMGSLKGAVAGGFLLGLIECLVRGYFIGDWVDAIAMGAIMIIIVVKPSGLFGGAHAEA